MPERQVLTVRFPIPEIGTRHLPGVTRLAASTRAVNYSRLRIDYVFLTKNIITMAR